MKKKLKSKKVELKYFIVSFLLITMTFTYLIHGAVTGWIRRSQDEFRAEAVHVAGIYSENLNKAEKARKLLLNLIDERLRTAGSALALRQEDHSNELLSLLAEELQVDVIYSFDRSGVLLFSSSGEHIGWRVEEGHPVHGFLHSGEDFHVEEIRRDTVSLDQYKYSYTRLPDGRFFQVGVRGENIEGLMKDFQMKELLQSMRRNHTVDFAHFIGLNHRILESTHQGSKGQTIRDSDITEAMDRNREVDRIREAMDQTVYEVYVPVHVDSVKIGTLAVGRNVTGMLEVASEMEEGGLLLLVLVIGVMGVLVLITYRNASKLSAFAYYDPLTKLPNQVYMKEYLADKLEEKKAVKKAVFLINVRNFRTINAALGFEQGDFILRALSERLDKTLKKQGILFRFTGDRFLFYVEGYEDKEDLLKKNAQIREAFQAPFAYMGTSKKIQAEIGLVEITSRYENPEDLMKDASITISALSHGTSDFCIFNEEMREKADREEDIELELIRAFENRSEEILHLEYQPKVNVRTGRIIGFEALARMNSKKLGKVSPVEFIAIAEKKQLILPIGTMILEKACLFTRRLISMGHSEIRMAVNISAIQLLMDDFVDTVLEIVSRTGIETKNLELEITESIMLENYTMINEVLERLRETGVEVSMDDFGTGFSSLASIAELNIDIVKIDRHFIMKIKKGTEKNLITGDIISMARKLGLQVIAEGVESTIQRDYLLKSHCEIMQGYFFSRPLTEENTLAMLKGIPS